MRPSDSGEASMIRNPRAGLDLNPRELLREMFLSAISAADPAKLMPDCLPPPPKGRCVIVGAGKAAASMAAAVEREWSFVELSGCVTAPYGYGLDCEKITVREAGHPVPDANSVAAAQEILEEVNDLTPNDLVLALISGGGSATMCLPAEGITLAEKQLTNRLLLNSGFDIRTMNAVRQRLSAIKGGRLAAAAAPAQVITLAISDIPGDTAEAIASGPTAQTGYDLDYGAVLARLGSQLPDSVRKVLTGPLPLVRAANASPIKVIATANGALDAAAKVALQHGIEPITLGDAIEGEARMIAEQMARDLNKYAGPCVLLSGGETTVTIGDGRAGRGGRNTEFLLALALAIDGPERVWALAADTDGEDGHNLGAAGAIMGPDTLDRARTAGLDAETALVNHDSGGFFATLDDLIVTGPTLTNVNDFRAILIMPPACG